MEKKGKGALQTNIVIPAYDTAGNGLIVHLLLIAEFSTKFSVSTVGIVADLLKRNFERIIDILAAINKSWECLTKFKYRLECTNDKFYVKDARSSSMALCIGLLNICREINHKPQVSNIIGTGILRIDGSFEKTCFEDKKQLAAKNEVNYKSNFITALKCNHVFELDKIINKNQN